METKERLWNGELDRELRFSFSRSGGPGGQHANKVSTKVELRFDIRSSALLSRGEKERLLQVLAPYVKGDGELLIVSQSGRSQWANRQEAIARFYQLINKALQPVKERKETKVPRQVKRRRLEAKRQQAEKKGRRRKDKSVQDEE